MHLLTRRLRWLYRIHRADLVNTALCSGKDGGFIPLATRGIELTTADNKSDQFLLAEPEQ